MSNWQQEGGTEAEVREDAPEPEDERWEMDEPSGPDADDAEGPREDAPNPTQAAIDEQGASDRPVDVGGWLENEDSPHEGEGRQADDVA